MYDCVSQTESLAWSLIPSRIVHGMEVNAAISAIMVTELCECEVCALPSTPAMTNRAQNDECIVLSDTEEPILPPLLTSESDPSKTYSIQV